MLELAIAVALTGALLATSTQVLKWTLSQRQSADRRAAALVEAGNVLDKLTRLPWEEATSERLQAVELSPEAAALLPEAKLNVALQEADDEVRSKRLTVTIDWQGNHGQREGPVRLTAWMYEQAPHE